MGGPYFNRAILPLIVAASAVIRSASNLARRRRVLFDLVREVGQRVEIAARRVVAIGAVHGSTQRLGPILRECLAANELIDVGACGDEVHRPHDARLRLHVELGRAHLNCRVDLGLRHVLGGHQPEDVDAAHDLGSIQAAVVPVGGPVAADHELFRVDRPAIEIRDLDRVG